MNKRIHFFCTTWGFFMTSFHLMATDLQNKPQDQNNLPTWDFRKAKGNPPLYLSNHNPDSSTSAHIHEFPDTHQDLGEETSALTTSASLSFTPKRRNSITPTSSYSYSPLDLGRDRSSSNPRKIKTPNLFRSLNDQDPSFIQEAPFSWKILLQKKSRHPSSNTNTTDESDQKISSEEYLSTNTLLEMSSDQNHSSNNESNKNFLSIDFFLKKIQNAANIYPIDFNAHQADERNQQLFLASAMSKKKSCKSSGSSRKGSTDSRGSKHSI